MSQESLQTIAQDIRHPCNDSESIVNGVILLLTPYAYSTLLRTQFNEQQTLTRMNSTKENNSCYSSLNNSGVKPRMVRQ